MTQGKLKCVLELSLTFCHMLPSSGGAEQQQRQEEEEEEEEEMEEDQVVPQRGNQEVSQLDREQLEQLEDSEPPQVGGQEAGQPKDDRSSSSPSLFSDPPDPDEGPLLLHSWEGVLREGTATPSEVQGGRQGEQGGSGGGRGGGAQSAEVGGVSPEGQQDVSSEPEMVNDSSAEDEPGGREERRGEGM